MPQLGIEFHYHKQRVQIVVALLANLLAIGAYLIQPTTGQFIVILVVLVLTPFSGFLYANKTLVPLDYPQYVNGAEAPWRDETRIIGYAPDDETAYAWALDTLIPHHLINDEIGEQQILVCW